MLKSVIRWVGAFVVCVLIAEILAATASTQFVLHGLAELGVPVPIDERLTTTLHDIVGMLPLYGLVIGVAFLIGLPVAALICRALPGWRQPLYTAAGGTGIVTAILVLRASFGIMPIAGARSFAGLVLQGVAGAVAGWLFARFTARPIGAQPDRS